MIPTHFMQLIFVPPISTALISFPVSLSLLRSLCRLAL
jgi:hypothetical protein